MEEKEYLTEEHLVELKKEFEDLTTNPAYLCLSPINAAILVSIGGISVGSIIAIKKFQIIKKLRAYKSSEKKVFELQDLIDREREEGTD